MGGKTGGRKEKFDQGKGDGYKLLQGMLEKLKLTVAPAGLFMGKG